MAKARREQREPSPVTNKPASFSTYVKDERFGIKVMSIGISRRDKESGEFLPTEQQAQKADAAVSRVGQEINGSGPDEVYVLFTNQGLIAGRLRSALSVLGAQEYVTTIDGTSREGEPYTAPRWAFVASHGHKLTDADALHCLERAATTGTWAPLKPQPVQA